MTRRGSDEGWVSTVRIAAYWPTEAIRSLPFIIFRMNESLLSWRLMHRVAPNGLLFALLGSQ